jgi:transcriptional regulator with XRE-family HTH domain
MDEHLGRRVAALRAQRGWTQQQLADRVGISRVAVSHLEAGITIPGERTVVLLAGLFKLEPDELVAGTSYPRAKRERLPLVACRYTEAELQVRLFDHDLAWLERLGAEGAGPRLREEVVARWRPKLAELLRGALDPAERAMLEAALGRLVAAATPPRPAPGPVTPGAPRACATDAGPAWSGRPRDPARSQSASRPDR